MIDLNIAKTLSFGIPNFDPTLPTVYLSNMFAKVRMACIRFLGNCNTVRAPRRPAKNFQRSRTAARWNQPPSFTLSEFVCEFVWLFTPFEFVFNFVCSIGYDYDCKVCSLPVSLDQYFFRFDVVFYWPLCWPPGARAVVAMVQVA